MLTTQWAETKLMCGDVMRVIAHDAFPVANAPLPPDFVMGVGGASTTLLDLTPRRHVERALDIGCGSGVQTLFLDADRIIATDIDRRALDAANASCHLSGFRRLDTDVWRNGDSLIEFREGSLLDPVEGQRFDLIVANPPFVIEGVGHVHRDSPFDGDGLTRELLATIPSFMNAGAIAVILASWLHPEGVDWRERIASWIPSDMGAWVAQRDRLDVDTYVDVWSADAAVPAAERLLWRARLEALDAAAIGFGWIVLHRGGTSWTALEDVSNATRVPSGAEVEAQIRAFGSPPTAVDLLAARWEFVSDHWRGPLRLSPVLAQLLEHLRGGAPVREAVAAVASDRAWDPDDVLAETLPELRDLAIQGYLRPLTI